ncbi:MAG TPA: zinc-dependent alcohol dehydrogenase [Gammaproteobacteria bacterium]|nr:zinc-dependent alcohol dehydrogenase [Gammaproteobacteria bacterium]HET7587672.1 zinc-dependent alcohol dehydrogenase [Gammaproteobacteria bacterium]
MKAVVFHGIGDIRLDDVAEPKIQNPTDAIVKITASAICGTDLHMIRGTLPGMKDGRVLGHEAVGVVEEVGDNVRNLRAGDRVVVPSTIACGYCSYCRAGYYAQCDNANPNGKLAGTAFYGGPESTGGFNGMQAEFVRVPFAHVNLVRLPEAVSDEQAILISDIFPTGYFGADLAEIKYGDTVAIFGCGPVGLFTIASAGLMGAGRILAIDQIPSRLDMARAQGAEVIDFSREDPVEAIRELTGGIGADRVIDAVGIDAVHPHGGPGDGANADQFREEVRQVAPDANPHDGNWEPGDAPSQALRWCVDSVAKAGTIAIIGVYSPQMQTFPIGEAMMKNLTVKMGNCNHRRYIPDLVNKVKSNVINPLNVLTQREPLVSAIDAYKTFDKREAGWTKVELIPGAAA